MTTSPFNGTSRLCAPENRSAKGPGSPLNLSPKTVMNYVSNVFAKINVADRAEMIVRARQAGFGEGDAAPDDAH